LKQGSSIGREGIEGPWIATGGEEAVEKYLFSLDREFKAVSDFFPFIRSNGTVQFGTESNNGSTRDPTFWNNQLFKETLKKYQTTHVDQYGSPGNHPYEAKRNDPSGGYPLLRNQCPV
jgi:hypothetical protein